MTASYDAFVSYRRADAQGAAHWIRRELQNFRSPKRLRDRYPTKLCVYLDTAYERGTNDFFEQNIKPALLASHYLVVLASPAAITRQDKANDWIWREIDVFQNGPNAGNILVVRIAGEFDGPLPADLKERFPNMEIIDLRNVSRLWFINPIRAARINTEKLKLLAPLLGISSDDMPILRQEEEKRQHARIGAVAGTTTAALIAISALSAFALQSRYRATQALESSMFATGRMISSVSDSLSRGDGTDVRTRLLNQACDLMDKLGAEATQEPDADPLVTCDIERGVAFERQGELVQAEGALKSAMALADSRYSAEPQEPGAYAILTARRELGEFYKRRKDEPSYRGALMVLAARAQDLFSEHADSPQPLISAADAERDVAVSFLESGEIERAFDAAEASVRLLGQASAASSDDSAKALGFSGPQLQERQAKLLTAIGTIHEDRKETDKAIDAYRRSLALWEPLLKSNFASIDGRFDAARAMTSLARLLMAGDGRQIAEPVLAEARFVVNGLAADRSTLNEKGIANLTAAQQAIAALDEEFPGPNAQQGTP